MKSPFPKPELIIRISLITLISMTAIAFGYSRFIEEFYEPTGQGVGPPVAKLEKSVSWVRRKRANHYVWRIAAEGERYYSRESLETGNESTADVSLIAGGQLEIQENSLIVFDPREKSGALVLEGSMLLRQEEQDYLISSRQESGPPSVHPLPIQLISPKLGEESFTKVGVLRKVNLRWASRLPPPPLAALELFNGEVLTEFKAPFNEPKKSVELRPGFYRWQMKSTSIPISGVRTFRVSEAAPLQPFLPADAAVLPSISPKRSVQFRWIAPPNLVTRVPTPGRHSLQISKSPNFKGEIAFDVPIDARHGQAMIGQIPIGTFYWRLSSHYGDLNLNSEIRQFMETKSQLANITLDHPRAGETLTQGRPALFAWTSDIGEAKFLVEVEWLEGADTRAAAMTAEEPRASWENPRPGHFRWKVSASSPNGQTVGQSEWQEFFVKKEGWIASIGSWFRSNTSSTEEENGTNATKKDDLNLGRSLANAGKKTASPRPEETKTLPPQPPIELKASWTDANQAQITWVLPEPSAAEAIEVSTAIDTSAGATIPAGELFVALPSLPDSRDHALVTLNTTAADANRDRWIRVRVINTKRGNSEYSLATWLPSYNSTLPSYPEVILADHPVGYWRLDESTGTFARDLSGNGQHGTYIGSPHLGVAGALTSDPNTAVNFTQNADYRFAQYVQVDGGTVRGSPLIMHHQMSVEAWAVLRSGNIGGSTLIAKAGPNLAEGYGLFTLNNSQVLCTYAVHWSYYHLCIPLENGPYPTGTEYHHIVGTYDGGVMNLYVDGVLVVSSFMYVLGTKPPLDLSLTAENNQANLAPLRIAGDTYHQWDGSVDEAAVYDYALSPKQVQDHFNARNRPVCRATPTRVCP